jgi:hypothetical protein
MGGEHVMPLQYLVQQDTVYEATQSDTQENTRHE